MKLTIGCNKNSLRSTNRDSSSHVHAEDIVPTLDAMAVLMVALNVQQILLGLVLILAYSLGITVVMSAVGMLFLISQELLARSRRFDILSRWSPAIAAAMVIVLGMVIVIRTVGL